MPAMTTISKTFGAVWHDAHAPEEHTLAYYQLMLGAGRVREGVVGLDKLAGRRAGIAANRIPRWRWQHAGISGQLRCLRAGRGMIAVGPRLVGGRGATYNMAAVVQCTLS